METVRCLIADMPQMVLADIVQKLTEESNDIEVVDRVDNLEDAFAALIETQANVLISGAKNTQVPERFTDILKKFSGLSIVCLAEDGRQLSVHLDDVGTKDIVTILRALRR
jgi:spore coat polysaccharide biosynthesis protein SpsF (cytidylyltransferase family)